ncbi:MAG: hypothetical protein PWQ41_295 [Bacillota bacterium]|jgi:cell division protein FtsB|nr:hypothetical protein [Bacillota bacterium]MDK2855345.1 hypothetical protein [Bacillota bacterium]MDK2924521.1 hypothetical protein [Bacillota bacterium]
MLPLPKKESKAYAKTKRREVNKVAFALQSRPRHRALEVPWQKKPRRRKRKFSWSKAVLLSLVLYFVYSSSKQVQLALELRAKLERVNKEIAATQQRTEELRREIEYLKSDAYVEKVAREELGLVKPGEIIFMPAVKPDKSR